MSHTDRRSVPLSADLCIFPKKDEDEISKRAFVVIANAEGVAVKRIAELCVRLLKSTSAQKGLQDQRESCLSLLHSGERGRKESESGKSIPFPFDLQKLLSVLNGLIYSNEANRQQLVREGGIGLSAAAVMTQVRMINRY